MIKYDRLQQSIKNKTNIKVDFEYQKCKIYIDQKINKMEEL